MATPIKNPTPWRPPSGIGQTFLIGNAPVLDNTHLLLIVDNRYHLPVLTSPTITVPKNPTLWSQTG